MSLRTRSKTVGSGLRAAALFACLLGFPRSFAADEPVSPMAPACTGNVTDASAVYSVPQVPKPAYLVPTIDPTFGTMITRIGGDAGTSTAPVAGTYGTDVRHHYHTDQPWSSDNSLYAIQNPSGSPVVLYLDGLTFVPRYGKCANYGLGDDWWNPNPAHPHERININGSRLSWFDVTTCTETRFWTLPFTAALSKSEGTSWNGKYAAIANSTGKSVVIVEMDPAPGRVGPVHNVTTDCGVNRASNCDIRYVDYMAVSPSGKYLVVWYDDRDYTRVYDINPSTLAITPRPTTTAHVAACHGTSSDGYIYDVGEASASVNPFDNNEDVVVGQEQCSNRDNGAVLDSQGKRLGAVVLVRLSDGRFTALTNPTNEGDARHVSALSLDNPGWAYVGYYPTSTGARFRGEVIAVKMDGSLAVKRLAHEHSDYATYRDEAHAVPSRDGQRVAFASPWSVSCGASCGSNTNPQDYIIDTCGIPTTTCSGAPDGTPCSDGNACTRTDTCQSGVCSGSNPVVCTASDACHDAGTCAPATGLCSNPPKGNGAACNDGNGCTQTDTCQGGVCTGSSPVTCTPSDACHVAGICAPATGLCSSPPKGNGAACDDGNACTRTDTCQSGVCTGSNPVTCTPSDACHVAGICDPATGGCSNPAKPEGAACSDGNVCTRTDACRSGVCVGSDIIECIASDACHDAGTCDPVAGCSSSAKPNGTACNDGNACTQLDSCQSGVCTGLNPVPCPASDSCHDAGTCDPSTGNCSNPVKAMGSACNDGNACTQSDTCQSGGCTGTPVVCIASDSCHDAGTCDPLSGCSNPAKANGTGCDDGNSCTQTDTCQSGACIGAVPVVCTASDACHDAGICAPATGLCSNPAKANGTACSDGNACTQTDACQGGVCTGSNPVTCIPSDPCHDAGTCDPSTGSCSDPAKPEGASCNDGNVCTRTDACRSGVCVGSSPIECTASDVCHDAGTCDPATGCSNPAKPNGTGCNDGNACTQSDSCQSGVCTGSSRVTCTASDACHDAGTCDPSTGTCSSPAKAIGSACNDGNACTQSDMCQSGGCIGTPVVCAASDSCHDAGTCDPLSGCSNPAKANGTGCDDGNACTQTDTCQGGACIGAIPIVCTASDACHDAGTCAPTTGLCSNPAKADGAACSDGNACTLTDTCEGGICTGSNPVTCTPSDRCHDPGTCNPATGSCSDPAKPEGASCNDGNACTRADVCQNGVCAGSAIECTATDSCHDAGSCDPATGCSNPAKPNGTGCNDGNACTQLDSCQSGVCTGSNPIACPASDSCHDAGTCAPATGVCSNPTKANGAACNDGNACTQSDACQNGVCTGSNSVACPASDSCHDAGTCAPATGLCSNPAKPNGTACSDGNACTLSDACQSGTCTGAPIVCTASDSCHVAGTCAPASGVCSNPTKANGVACSDGNACTQSDSCQNGVCTGTPVVCTASDSCHTAGTCAPATGLCSNPAKANGTTCTDGNACTLSDTCQSGVCTGTSVVCTASDSCHIAGTCSPATGVCSSGTTKANGAACSDGNPCTQSDTCQSGVCTGSNPVVCTAMDACHSAGTCNTATGVCSNPTRPGSRPCDDRNACTTNDKCQNGVCSGTISVTCTASDACHTVGTCSPATGQCSNPAAPNGTACNDGNAGTKIDTCQNGVCVGTNALAFSSTEACREPESCDQATLRSKPISHDGTACDKDADVSVRMAQVGGVTVITWNPATGGASFHVLRGLVRALPAGPAGGDKLSLASRASGASTTDPDTPDPDEAFWYLIRESATCP